MKKIMFLPILLLFATWSYGQYCIPTFPSGCTDDHIDNFSIPNAGFSHLATGCSTNQYGDFTADVSLNISLNAGVNYDFTATHNFATQQVRVWIDFNGDQQFDDPGELVGSAASTGSGASSLTAGTISIPPSATPTTTRMRVATRYSSAPIPCNTLGYGEVHDYTVNILPPPNCLAPGGLNATNLTVTTADLVWTENGTATLWDIEWGVSGFTPTGTPTISGATSTTQPISGLSNNTAYSFYVRADCGVDGYSTWSGPYTFTTPLLVAPPFTEGFATTTTPAGWDRTGWTIGSIRGVTGNPGNNIYKNIFNTNTTGSSFRSPAIGPVTVDMILSFDYIVALYSSPYGPPAAGSGDFVVEISTDYGATYTILETVANNGVAGWQSKIYPLTAYAGQDVVFKITGNWVSGDWDMAFDNFYLDLAPTCFDPSALTATNLTATSADLGWTENGTATLWDIEWGTSGFTPSGTPTIAGVNTNPYPLGGLSPNTAYEFYVRADCVVDGVSNWSGPFSFTTPCATVVAPWTEDFENGGTIPNCWSQGASNAKDWKFSNSGAGQHIGNNGAIVGTTTSGGYFAWVDDSTPTSLNTALESPLIDVGGLTNPMLSFYLISDNEGFTNVDFSVSVWDGAAWNTVFTKNSNTLNGGWEKFDVYLSSLTITGPIQLRFIVDENNGGDFYDDVAIDDVSVVEAPACPEPTLLTATNFTATSAELGWQENGSATAWDIEHGATGFTPSGTPTVSGVTNPYTLPGLSPATEYDYYVRADCAASGTSNWSGPFTFQTQCTALLAGNYTIGATGDYATFTDAVDALVTCGISAAVTFNVQTGSGPFTEQIIIPEIAGASAVNTITFNGNGETLTSTTSTGSRSLILLDGADYVTIDNLNLVTQSVDNNFVIQLTNNADFNTITNCTIDMTSTLTNTTTSNAGIVVSGSLTSATSTTGSPGTDNTFTNNTIKGGYYGLTINGESAAVNSLNNVITGNIVEDFRFYGIYLRSITDAIIANNEISRPTRADVSTFYGIYFVTSGERNLVEANKIHTPFTGGNGGTTSAYAIYHTGVDATVGNANKVINNLFYNIESNGLIYAFYNSGSDGVHYYHNTVSLDDPNATGGATRGLYQTTAATDIEFKNNIVTITRGGSGAKHALYFNTATTVFASDNNVLYVNSPGGSNNIGHLGSTSYVTLTDWQLATTGDMNSVDVDPIYVNALGGDFTPSSSAVNNMGAALGVLTDIDGNPRSAVTPDPGAYEFTPPACPQPSDLIATNITATTADLGWTENGTSTLWDIEFGPTGFTPTGVPTTAGVTTNPYTQGGLTELTTYDFYVRANCGGGDLSVWVGPYTFTTGCLAPLAGIYTIDAGGTGDYISLNEAVGTLITCGISAPVTFNVVAGSGPYDEQVIIPEIVGASAVNTITFNGNGETLTAMTTSSARSLILLDGADYITISDFNLVTQTDTNNFVIQLTNGADFNTVDNCVIDMSSAINSTSATNAGIVVSVSLTSYTVTTTGNAGSDNTFTNNTITGGHAGIAINGAASTPNSFNNVVDNNIINDNYSYGIYFRSVSNSSASHNSISRPVRSNTTTYSGLYFAVSGENNMIDSNRIFNTHGGITGNSSATYPIYHTAVDATPGNENWVVNNLIYDVKNNGTIYGIYNSSSDGVYYYHNTISLDDPDATAGLTRGIYQLTSASNIEIKNNIISITRGGTGTKYALYFGTTASTIASDNNVLYVNAPAGTNGVGFYSSAHVTLGDWQLANGGIYDNASVDASPNFANPSGGQFSPTNAAVDNIGTPVGVVFDIEGNPRSVATPDAGAYEFSPPACFQPSALTATNITITSADLGWTEIGTSTIWDIEWGVGGFTPTGTPTITGTTTNPQPITGLTGSTTYDFYVRSNCGVDGFSNWSGPYSFTTLCDAFIAPYTMDFEASMTNTPLCWSISSSVANGWTFATSPSSSNSYSDHTTGSGYFAFAEASSTYTPDATMVTPLIDISGLTEPMFEFYVYHYDNNTSTTSVSNSLTVEVFDGTNWNLVYFDNNGDVNAWERVEVDLSTLTITGNIQARFIVDATVGSNFYNDIGIDDVSFYEGFVCLDPSALTASNLTTSSADLGWTENGTATMWDIEWGTAGFTPSGTPTIAGVTTNPYPLTGLTPNTMYEFYVRADCGGGDLSAWAGPFLFETLQVVCDAPTALTLVNVTDTTAEISWTASATETGGYAWYVFADGDNPLTDPSLFNGTVATGITTVTVAGLTASTDYDVYVSTLCTTGIESGLAGPLNVLTDATPVAPVNDDCTDAIMLTVGIDFPDQQVVGTNENGSNDPNDLPPTCDAFNFATNGKDVWYTVVVPISGNVTVETKTNGDPGMNDTGIQVYSGACGNIATTSLGCNADGGDGFFSLLSLTGLNAGDVLLVRVWGYNLNEGEFLISAYDDTVCEMPSALTIDNVTDTTINFSWTTPVDISNVDGYFWRLMNSGDNPFVDPPVDEEYVPGATSTSAVITGLTAVTNYDLYLVTVCDEINEFVSDPIMIAVSTVSFVCQAPTNITQVQVDVDFAEFSWTASPTETNGYDWAVFIAGDDPLVDPAVTSGSVATGVTSVIVTGLTAETTYDFYVRTDCDPDGLSDWEGPSTFTTQPVASVNDFDINSIVFYPNPMVDVVNISAQIEIEKVVIFSITGQMLIEQRVGNTNTQIDVSNFATGPYLLYVTTSTGKVGVFNLIKK